VSARREGARAEIEIGDRGCGMAPETLERVYEPFYTTKPKGTGLGLATVHRVVEAHGGSISIASELGKGTTVRVSLPSP
jgi:signal transduction histidine kinase